MLTRMVHLADETPVAHTYSDRMRNRPLVVFLDSYSWQAFTDLAGGLRQRGVRVARVGSRSRSPRVLLMQSLESWVFGRTRGRVLGGVLLGRPASISLEDLRAAVPRDAADVQMQEDLIGFGMADPGGPADISRRVREGVDARVLVDKWVQGEWAERAGVPTPRTWLEPVTEQFPVVVKTRVGFGGNGVRVVHDDAELAQAWTDLTSPEGESPFLQECLTTSVHTGGVAKDGETLINVVYDGRPAPDDPTGPPYTVFAVRDDQAIAATERFLGEIGYTGFFCFDWVVDAEGTLRLIDFNSRVFGSWPALQELGFDFLSAYVHVLGAAPRPQASTGRFDEPTTTLRYPCPDTSSREAVERWRAETLEIVRRRRPLLGSRWATVIRVRTALGTARALRKVRASASPSAEQSHAEAQGGSLTSSSST